MDRESTSEILVVDTDSESGDKSRDEEYKEEEEEQQQQQDGDDDKPHAEISGGVLQTCGPYQGRNTKISILLLVQPKV
jgi:hypothetical protein